MFEGKVTKLKFLLIIFAVKNHGLKIIYSFLYVHVVAKNIKRKKSAETVKKELLNSLRERDTVEESDFSIQKIIDQGEVIERIKHYDEIVKTGSKQTIRYESRQGQLLKNLKIPEDLLKALDLVNQQFILKLDFINFKRYTRV